MVSASSSSSNFQATAHAHLLHIACVAPQELHTGGLAAERDGTLCLACINKHMEELTKGSLHLRHDSPSRASCRC